MSNSKTVHLFINFIIFSRHHSVVPRVALTNRLSLSKIPTMERNQPNKTIAPSNPKPNNQSVKAATTKPMKNEKIIRNTMK